MFVTAPLLLALAPLATTPQDQKPDAEGLVAEAWQLLPAYDGEHRWFLTETVRKETSAAAHLLQAALELGGDQLRTLWSLGHAHILLAEDRKNRGLWERAHGHYGAATDALTRALELDPGDPWAAYARGTAHANFGAHDEALADLARAVESAEAQIAGAADSSSAAWLRFKALEWRCEVLMRARRHERAREELRAYHGEFSSNEWPLQIALAENHQRERDFAGARADYEQALALFPSDHQAHALLGYLEGLLGNRAAATQHMLHALELELQPGLYTRIWMWILATDEHRPAAEEDLRGFLANPPQSTPEWDLRLGRFLLGAETPEDFVAAGESERERRMAAGEMLDSLMSEVWFYAGLRLERDAAQLADQTTSHALLERALASHVAALEHAPIKWKWEWAYARLHYSRLASSTRSDGLGLFELDGARLTWSGGTGTLERASWHDAGWPSARTEYVGKPGPGTLLLGTVRGDDGVSKPFQLVVGVH